MSTHPRGSWSDAKSTRFWKWHWLVRGIWRNIWRWENVSSPQGSFSKLPFKGDRSYQGGVGTICAIFFSHGCTRFHSLWREWRFCYKQQRQHGQNFSWKKVSYIFSAVVNFFCNTLSLEVGKLLGWYRSILNLKDLNCNLDTWLLSSICV